MSAEISAEKAAKPADRIHTTDLLPGDVLTFDGDRTIISMRAATPEEIAADANRWGHQWTIITYISSENRFGTEQRTWARPEKVHTNVVRNGVACGTLSALTAAAAE